MSVVASAQSKLSREITDMLQSVDQQICDARNQNHSNSLDSSSRPFCPVDTVDIQNKMVVSFHADGSVKTIDVVATLAEGVTCPTAGLEAKGIRVKDQVSKFVFLAVPVSQLHYLETLEEFVSLSENTVYHATTDNARSMVNVSNINGIDFESYTFDTPYTGKGVVVGIVDVGIDYNHISFKDSEGNTRVKKVVNYSGKDSAVEIETSPEDIAMMTTDGNEDGDYSHGTHVAGCAVGSIIDATVDNALGSRKIGGVAPEADIVLCGVHVFSSEHIARSVEEIVKTAEELDEPCVINFSFGTTGGWHDGLTTTSEVIKEYARDGVVFCMSTANDGQTKWTVDKTIPANGYLKFIPRKLSSIKSYSRAYFPTQTITIHLPQCTDPEAVSCSFEVVDSLTGIVTTLDESPLRGLSDNVIVPSITFRQDVSHRYWVVGELSLELSYFEENSQFLVVKLQNTTDSDLRAYVMSNRQANGLHRESLACTDFPGYEYDKGTADMSMNNSCSGEYVITVGAYTIEPKITGFNGKEYQAQPNTPMIAMVGAANSTAGYSSYGRDDFGKSHPDVIAPGTFLVSAYSQFDTSKAYVTNKSTWVAQYICAYLTDSNGFNHLFYRDQGTSMAAPVVSGIVALWLQAYPQLTADEVREIIQRTSRTVVNGAPINITAGYTELNRQQLGYGLIDAEAGMKYLLENIIPTSIAGINDHGGTPMNVVKKLVNGKIVIEKNGKRYNTMGQKVK